MTMTKALARIKAHPAVSDAFSDSDGTWIYLRAGFGVAGCFGEHIMVEDTVSQALRRLGDIQPCSCKECRESLAA
jgi:hypothetical protein